jgi:hypothetical protein
MILITACLFSWIAAVSAEPRWSAEKANAWYRDTPWLVGCNFAPSTAINQLEMWQADTFDLATIDRELGWAEQLGFNSVRVFLHHLLWQRDKEAFLKRIDQFLEVASRHKIGVMLVPLDGVWDPFPKLGKQRDPKPHTHNSGWLQSPGAEILKDTSRHNELEGYIKGIIGRYRTDKRVQVWDVFNEPDNPNRSAYGHQELPNKAELATALLMKVFAWAREVDPAQPLTAGLWRDDWPSLAKMSAINRLMIEQSDVISFHNYSDMKEVKKSVGWLKQYGRPLLCTEYMARPRKSTFDPILGYFKEQKIGAYNWGFVSGKSQTIYPWDSWTKTYQAEPKLWFHDIFRQDGTPYLKVEVDYIKEVTGKR